MLIISCNGRVHPNVILYYKTHFNPFPNDKFKTLPNWKGKQTTSSNLMKLAESYPNGQKTLWEKEKLLDTSNFSFSHSVFKRLVRQTRKNKGLFGKGVNPFPNKPLFLLSGVQVFWKYCGKRRSSRFPQCILSFWRTFCHFHLIQNCRLQTLSIWKSLKFVVSTTQTARNHLKTLGEK